MAVHDEILFRALKRGPYRRSYQLLYVGRLSGSTISVAVYLVLSDHGNFSEDCGELNLQSFDIHKNVELRSVAEHAIFTAHFGSSGNERCLPRGVSSA